MKVHFIGIGGIGISALARYYLEKGYEVSGSDLASSEITTALRKKGKINIKIGPHKEENLPQDADLVIYTTAVTKNNAELQKAKRYKLKTKSYPEALGELTKNYYTIAVCGSHGKSTTTAMVGLILVKAGLDPTVIVGTKLKEFGNSNCRVGKSQYLVIEADEHFAAFLNYWPKIIVVTNIEKDHLDFYKNLDNVKKAFKKFISHLPKDGVLITDKRVKKEDFKKLRKILRIPGEHNVYNAALALETARALKIPDKVSLKVLSKYSGSWRRFEEHNLKPSFLQKSRRKLKIISDYAHHPTEIKVTLMATREKYPKRKIWCIFQPHQYQRTYYLFKDFVNVFQTAPVDKIIITDIYNVAGRENPQIKQKVSSKKLVQAIGKDFTVYIPNDKIIKYLRKNLRGGEVVIIMGAGDINNLISKF